MTCIIHSHPSIKIVKFIHIIESTIIVLINMFIDKFIEVKFETILLE